MSPVSYHCRPHNRVVNALITGQDLYGTRFSTLLQLQPKPASLDTTADILLGSDWLRDCAIHAIQNRPDPAPAAISEPLALPAEDISAVAPEAPAPLEDDKDKDKDNTVLESYDNHNRHVNNPAFHEAASPTTDPLLHEVRNNAAEPGPSSQASQSERLSPCPIQPSLSSDLPDIVFNAEATAEQQRDNSRSLFHDNIFSHRTTHGRTSVFSTSPDELRTLTLLHGLTVGPDATGPGLRDAILQHLLHGKCKEHALGIPATDVLLCKTMSCGYTSTDSPEPVVIPKVVTFPDVDGAGFKGDPEAEQLSPFKRMRLSL
ncbi:hypothetical protein C8J56DRAFT_287009 [Mycena floridula]|nr:hypothetical protein C8J56DRAFT_905536 [Mycena floridula]KAJ7596375.1 hypothetical protein C8J56DRAFT_287009 [Mycena floridula]